MQGQQTADGAGVRLTRMLGHSLQKRLDPFLMLDAFGSDNPADYLPGFPDHPHRGFESITYMLAGRMRHRDSVGNEGILETGGMQWMTAARGVIHSELPEQRDGAMAGFQLWLNLPAGDKMNPPWYRDFPPQALPTFVTDSGVATTVLAGSSHGIRGAVVREHTRPVVLDIRLPAGSCFSQRLPAEHNAFFYVCEGQPRIADRTVPEKHMVILRNNPDCDGVVIEAETDTRLFFVSGAPLNEPIAQYGPFVMNTEQQIYEAISDYRNGRFTTKA